MFGKIYLVKYMFEMEVGGGRGGVLFFYIYYVLRIKLKGCYE